MVQRDGSVVFRVSRPHHEDLEAKNTVLARSETEEVKLMS